MRYELIEFIKVHQEIYPDLYELYKDCDDKEKQFSKANDNYNAIKKEIDAKYEKLKQDELGPHYAKAMAIKEPWTLAEQALEKRAGEIRLELANKQEGPLKEGTLYTYWGYEDHGWYRTHKSQIPKFDAVIEIWSNKSLVPGNRGRWRDVPLVGDIVLRRLKKDGTPSTMFDGIYKWKKENPIPSNYHPKGVNPNANRPQ